MKNPFFLGILWLLCFILEIGFSWNIGNINFRPFISYLIVGYAFFVLPPVTAFCFGSVVFMILSSFTIRSYFPFFSLLSLYGLTFWLNRKTFIENLFAKAAIVFFVLFLSFYLAQLFYGISFFISSFTVLDGILSILYLLMNLLLSFACFWVLEVKGAVWEEKLLSIRFKKDPSGFSKVKPSKQHRSLRFSSTRSIKRRLILRDSW